MLAIIIALKSNQMSIHPAHTLSFIIIMIILLKENTFSKEINWTYIKQGQGFSALIFLCIFSYKRKNSSHYDLCLKENQFEVMGAILAFCRRAGRTKFVLAHFLAFSHQFTEIILCRSNLSLSLCIYTTVQLLLLSIKIIFIIVIKY